MADSAIETDVPSISWIRDEWLRGRVVATWEEAVVGSPYASIADAPQSRHLPARSLLEHVNEVVILARSLLDTSAETFGLEPDADTVLAGAVLHDVDKPLLYRRAADGSVGYAPGYGSQDHGPVGADLAEANGVPSEVADLIRYHSPFREGRGLPGTVEGTIVHFADLAAADLSTLVYGTQPFHTRMRLVPREPPSAS